MHVQHNELPYRVIFVQAGFHDRPLRDYRRSELQ